MAERIEAEVAVVGAGPAGIVVALTLARAGHRVVLLESGGEEYDERAQRLGDLAGEDPMHVSAELSMRRQVGGSSNLWGGRCVPFDPIDFEPRPLVGATRWPVSHAELAPHLQAACDWCVCGEAKFRAGEIPELAGRTLVPGFRDGEVLASELERWSLPTNFGRVYGEELRGSPFLRLETGVTVTEVVPRAERAPDGERRVECLRGRRADGTEVEVHAERHVLAAGGLGATRLLFASRRHDPEGLGNHSGHLGRWYQAHTEVRVARVVFTTPPGETIYGHERDGDGVYVRRRFTFSPELQRRRRLPNAAFWMVNPEIGDAAHGSAVLSFVYLMLASPLGGRFVAEGIRQAHLKTSRPASLRAHLRNVLADLPRASTFALRFAWERFLRPGRKVPGFFVPSAANAYPLLYHGEHLPHRQSTALPSEEVDELGMPRLRTELHFGEEDVRGVLDAHAELDRALREQGLGHVEMVHADTEAAIREQLFGGYHQAGTTRMAAAAEDGVLDGELAVHGFGDLYVASSAAFPTSGQANSTFQLIVFAVRLAERLKRELATPRRSPSGAGRPAAPRADSGERAGAAPG